MLKDLVVLDPERRHDVSPEAVVRLSQAFPQLDLDTDVLSDEFLEYQLQDDEDLPKDKTIDKFWGCMGKKKSAGQFIFSNISKLMKSLLCIPHSNASSERTFSMVRKIVTENQTDLANDTVCALLSCKLNSDCRASDFKPTKDELQYAKSATYLYNQAHRSK